MGPKPYLIQPSHHGRHGQACGASSKSYIKILLCNKQIKLYSEGKFIIKVIKSNQGLETSHILWDRAPHST